MALQHHLHLACSKQGTDLCMNAQSCAKTNHARPSRAVSPHLIRCRVVPCASGQGGTGTLAPWLIIANVQSPVARVLETSCDGHHDELPELIGAHDRYLYGRHTCAENSLGCGSLIRLLAIILLTYDASTRIRLSPHRSPNVLGPLSARQLGFCNSALIAPRLFAISTSLSFKRSRPRSERTR